MSEETVAGVAYEARNRAEAAHDKMDAHERLCAERYQNINNSMSDLKTGLKWLAGLLLSVLIAVSGWSLTQQATSVTQKQDALTQQLLMALQRSNTQQQPTAPPGR